MRTRSQALKEAARRWGAAAAVEDRGPKYASSPEKRAAAELAGRELRERLTAEKGDRKNWTKEDREQLHATLFASLSYRYKVGRVMLGMFFEVKGEGDTWDEAFVNVDHAAALDVEWARGIVAKRKAEEQAARRQRRARKVAA